MYEKELKVIEVNGKLVIGDKMKYHEIMGVRMDLVLFYHLGRIIRPIHGTIKEQGNEFMKLSSVQRNIVGNLYAHGDCTIGELAEFAGCSYKNMSKFLDDIVEQEIVERYIMEGKRRYVYVRITEKGKALHEDFLQAAYTEATRVFDESFTDEEQLKVLEYYTKLGDLLSNFDKHKDTSRDDDPSKEE
ncbi:MAG: MarR family winged helix-turn-helix transcriptional regulator [Clostridia bacterium]|nr:MarR family winged helix-turn-helix transcriptional regulator [Clostridia bacterium]